MKTAAVLAVLLVLLVSSGCGGKKQAKISVPAPPPPASTTEPRTEPSAAPTTTKKEPELVPPVAEGPAENLAALLPPDAQPISEETGTASWYGAPYHNRRGSNGEIYNMHAMTAAHRTLPLGSIVRVTNTKTGSVALVRITDRGPFVEGRILDLSFAAAKKLDVYLPGTATVRVEVMQTPLPIDRGGRWAVQIGAFKKQKEASDLADHLERRYHTAKILRFASPVGDWWVRVRVLDDDRKRAEEVAHDTQTSEGSIFLVRLD